MKRYILMLLGFVMSVASQAREVYNFNSGWLIDNKKPVTLPHAWNEDEAFKVNIADMSTSVVWYYKTFTLPASASGKKVFLEFEGARQAAEVYVNGSKVGLSEDGVMAFGFDVTSYLKDGENNIKVMTNNDWLYREKTTNAKWRWNDKNFYSNYGGLNKNVRLHIMDKLYQTLPLYQSLGTTGVYVYAKDFDIPGREATICVESQVKNDQYKAVNEALEVIIEEMDGREVARFSGDSLRFTAKKTATLTAEQRVGNLHFWSWGYGYLYNVKTIVGTDTVTTTTGFRKAEFKNGMIYLNDRVMMVHGYAQRTTNEWPGVGMSVPAWMSDYSNDMQVKGGSNMVRWMHVTPWKQDVESCDRVGLPQAMPAGDAEGDVTGVQWGHRTALMRNAMVYNRNSPSILFYEGGNAGISREHMVEMLAIRDEFDPHGGRAMGSRDMLDIEEAEYGGQMLYVNKSRTKPMWMMEYCRDEGIRLHWNAWSYPFHKEGDGPLYSNFIKADDDTAETMVRLAGDTPVEPGNVWLHVQQKEGMGDTMTLLFEDDDTPDAVETVTVKKENVRSYIYGLDGRRVDVPTHGVYIMQGRKMVVK